MLAGPRGIDSTDGARLVQFCTYTAIVRPSRRGAATDISVPECEAPAGSAAAPRVATGRTGPNQAVSETPSGRPSVSIGDGTGSSAAWLARSVRDAEAGGSNPPFPTGEIAGQSLEGERPRLSAKPVSSRSSSSRRWKRCEAPSKSEVEKRPGRWLMHEIATEVATM